MSYASRQDISDQSPQPVVGPCDENQQRPRSRSRHLHLDDPLRIAASLKRSAERSKRRKAGAYRSALSMLTFHINRAGRNLPATQKKVLEKAKVELRKQFGRE
jgi:hypothetical protein